VLDGSLFYFVVKWLLAQEDYFIAFSQLWVSSCLLFGSAMMKVDGINICRNPYFKKKERNNMQDCSNITINEQTGYL